MARRVEEIKRVRRDIRSGSDMAEREMDNDGRYSDRYEEEYYDVGDRAGEESGLNAASGILAIALLALAIYLIWAALQ